MKSFENKDEDNPQSRQFSLPQFQEISGETQDQRVNKNIENLKKLQKTETMFNEIYDTLCCISMENDLNAMDFAIKEGFCNLKNEKRETIYDHSIKKCNLNLSHLIVEFSGNASYNRIIPKESDFTRFIVKTQHFDAKEALIWASRKGHYDVVKLLLTVPGIDANAKDRWNYTALIYASRSGHHEVVKLLLTVPGIDVNAKDRGNKTALIYASLCCHHEVVKLLLTIPGIDVNARDFYYYTDVF